MLMLGQAKKVVDEFGQTRLGTPAADAKPADHAGGGLWRARQGRPGAGRIDGRAGGRPDVRAERCLSAPGRRPRRATSTARWRWSTTSSRASPATPMPGSSRATSCSTRKNQPDEALAAYRKALAGEPKYVPAHAAILSVLMQQGKLDDAGKQLERAEEVCRQEPADPVLRSATGLPEEGLQGRPGAGAAVVAAGAEQPARAATGRRRRIAAGRSGPGARSI